MLLACEVISWCVLSTWDARQPRYKSTVEFELKSLPMNNTASDWLFYVGKAASSCGANKFYVSRPLFYGEVKDLKDMYRQIEWRVRRLFTKNPNWGAIYQLTVIASVPSQAADQANMAAAMACNETATIYEEYLEAEHNRWLKEARIAAKQARSIGALILANTIEVNLRAVEMQTRCFLPQPMKILEKAIPSGQKISTFESAETQSMILGLILIAAIVVRPINPRASSISPNPVA